MGFRRDATMDDDTQLCSNLAHGRYAVLNAYTVMTPVVHHRRQCVPGTKISSGVY